MLIKVRWPRTIGAIAALFIIGMALLALGSSGLHYFRLWLAGGEQCIIFVMVAAKPATGTPATSKRGISR